MIMRLRGTVLSPRPPSCGKNARQGVLTGQWLDRWLTTGNDRAVGPRFDLSCRPREKSGDSSNALRCRTVEW